MKNKILLSHLSISNTDLLGLNGFERKALESSEKDVVIFAPEAKEATEAMRKIALALNKPIEVIEQALMRFEEQIKLSQTSFDDFSVMSKVKLKPVDDYERNPKNFGMNKLKAKGFKR